MSFNFGTPKTATGFTLPTTNTTTLATAGGGAGDNKVQTKPLSNLFGVPGTNTTGFSLGASVAKTTAPTFNFGNASTTAAPFSLGTASTAPPQFNFGGATATTTPVKLTSVVTPASSVATPQFSLGAVTTTTSTGSFMPIFATGASLTPASTSTTPATAAPLKLTPSLAAPATSSMAITTPSLNLGTSAPTLALTTSAPSLSLAATSIAAPAVTTVATTAASSSALTYSQLEDSINKWTIDLEEQGKFFINQAKQLNAWDSLLVSNSEKIVALNDTIERVKQQQKQLDQELDFVLAQQNELDELSLPLEKQLVDYPITDQSRFQTYQLSEIIDSQLKQMSEDLKEIVEHLNESNKNEDISDPVVQVGRILNAHMNSLQWIDRNTTQISSHLEQISKLHEINKQNHLNL